MTTTIAASADNASFPSTKSRKKDQRPAPELGDVRLYNEYMADRWRHMMENPIDRERLHKLMKFKHAITSADFFGFSHEGTAMWIAEFFGPTLKFIPGRTAAGGEFRIYTRRHSVWQTLSETEILTIIRACCKFILMNCALEFDTSQEGVVKTRNASFAPKVLSQLKIQDHISMQPHEWDAVCDSGAIPFAYHGGAILFEDVITPDGGREWDYQLLEPGVQVSGEYLTQQAGCPRAIDVAYSANDIQCPLWDDLVLHVSGGDEETARFLKRWAGYCALNSTKEHKFLVLWGASGTGKSTFGTVLREVLGDYAISYEANNLMVRSYSKHNAYNSLLKGKRLAIIDEVAAGDEWDTAKINKIVAGGEVEGQAMYQNPESFTPTTKLMFMMNGQPKYSNHVGLDRRLIMLQVKDKISEADKDVDLNQKLRAEYGSILEWIIEGALEYLNNGLGIPESVARETSQFLAAGSPFTAWFTECAIPDRNASTPISKVYSSYEGFCRAIGVKAESRIAFNSKMEMEGMQQGRTKTDRIWSGLRLKHPAVTT